MPTPGIQVWRSALVVCFNVTLVLDCRPEAKHQVFKRMGKTTYWPQMLTQFGDKHNMRVAYELEERQHINQAFNLVDGTSTDTLCVAPGSPMHYTIATLSRCENCST